MKRTIIILLANFALADGALGAIVGTGDTDWPALLSVSTNVDGRVLILEFADVSVVAGERLKGRMVVSNALPRTEGSKPLEGRSGDPNELYVAWTSGAENGYLDTAIGQFVVMDDEGNTVAKTFWWPKESYQNASGRGTGLAPGDSMAFPGDIVKKYSLTNPGIYLVKAVAMMPLPPTSDQRERMIIETPIVAVTVLRRPEGMPPPEPLHTAREIANTPKTYFPLQLQVTHPKPVAVPRVPRAVPRDGNSQAAVMPPKVQSASAQPNNTLSATPDQPAPTTRTRNAFYALAVLLLVGGLGIYLWSRRKHGHL